MLYFMRGYMPIMYGHLKPRTFRLLSGMGYGVGSLLMMAGGVLMLVRVSKDAGEEDTAPLPHQKVCCMLHLSLGHARYTKQHPCMHACPASHSHRFPQPDMAAQLAGMHCMEWRHILTAQGAGSGRWEVRGSCCHIPAGP